LPTLAVVVLLAGLWWRREAWARPWQFCAGYFILALLPVLGVANLTYFAHSLVADHFQYLASMGPLAFLGAGIVRWTDSAPPKWNRPMLAGGALVLILGVLTWERAWAYQSEEEIWNDTLVKNPNSWEAYNNLGLLYASQGREDDAIRNYEKALAVTPKEMGPDPGAPNPPYAQTCNNIGNALLRERKFDAAIGEYRQALSLDAHYAEANNNLGYALLNQGKTAEAIRYFRRALEINPDDAGAHNNLGIALAQTGRMADALAQFREALRLKPDSADARANVSKAEAALGNRPPAR
jgi:Flp pilus assembly protein TadD